MLTKFLYTSNDPLKIELSILLKRKANYKINKINMTIVVNDLILKKALLIELKKTKVDR
jgi:hypothetical protein